VVNILVSFRLPVAYVNRIRAIAKADRISVASVVRRVFKHGLAVIDPEQQREEPRRKVLSRGVY